MKPGVATGEQLDNAASQQSQSNKRLGRILVENGTISDNDLLDALSRQLRIPHIMLAQQRLYETAATKLIPRDVARRLEILPMFKVHDTLTVATTDPQQVMALDELQDISDQKSEFSARQTRRHSKTSGRRLQWQ